jgi:hypothetical protein
VINDKEKVAFLLEEIDSLFFIQATVRKGLGKNRCFEFHGRDAIIVKSFKHDVAISKMNLKQSFPVGMVWFH